MATPTELRNILDSVVTEGGAQIDDIKVSKAGSRRVIEVILDSDEGIDLDLVAKISHAISAQLDESNIMGNAPYTLEVGSRGVDSPLVTPAHWNRNAGRLVKIVGSSMDVVGRILGCDGTTVDVDLDGVVKTYNLADISRATVQVEFKSSKHDESE